MHSTPAKNLNKIFKSHDHNPTWVVGMNPTYSAPLKLLLADGGSAPSGR
jgi:hypothetical protein